jgi:pimeloyl-ACP methyl ester carboxylesterase
MVTTLTSSAVVSSTMPTYTINGIDLHYEVTGQGDPIVFIHGLGSSTRDWQSQVEFFSKTHQVVTVDLRGHGQSSKPKDDYSVQQFANDVGQLLEETDHFPAHVVGLSLGGMVAFELAVSRPQLVRSLVVVNSGPEMPRETWWIRAKVWLMLFLRTLIVRLFGMRRLGETLAAKLLPEAGQEELREVFIKRWAENDPQAYLASMWALRRWSVASRLGTIACPTCVVAGQFDYTPLEYKQAYAGKIPQATIISIPASRHLTPIDRADLFNEAVASFLNRCS